MDNNLSVTFVFIAAISAIAFVIYSILSFRYKANIIKSGLIDSENVKLLSLLNEETKFKALKWALQLFSGGMGLIVLQFLPFNANSIFTYGFEAVFLSFGFFVYYILVHKNKI